MLNASSNVYPPTLLRYPEIITLYYNYEIFNIKNILLVKYRLI